jgi:hypothetical protein
MQLSADITAAHGRTKGMGWSSMIRWYERQYGRAKLLEVVAQMPERYRRGLDERHETLGVLEATWYAEDARNSFFEVISTGLTPTQQNALARGLTDAVMQRSVRGLHRVIFELMATPERFVKRAQSFWDVHHDTGRLKMKLLSPTSAQAAVVEWPGHHPFGCLCNHWACVHAFAAMGCKEIVQQRVCTSDGAAECTGIYYWRA